MNDDETAHGAQDGSPLRAFLESQSAGGLVLMAAAACALLVANSPFDVLYFAGLKAYVLGMTFLHWINDGLMAIFFLLIGLEIKRECVNGHLATWPRRILPGVAAFGGMIVPALIYAAFNGYSPQRLVGWAIPAATDIAFALGLLSLLGSRVPASLKIFLTALAILDDLGAIVIIALFYTAQLSMVYLVLAALIIGLLICVNRAGVTRLAVYLALGLILWFAVLKSGVHPTLAGVALALTIPLSPRPDAGVQEHGQSPLLRLEHGLGPWVAFLVLPVFGFANAGLSLAGVGSKALAEPVMLGVALGLLLGKQLGVFGFAWVAISRGLAQLPVAATWRHLYGVSLLCGIGFTMSLFIGLLAFPADPALQEATKLGVLLGSLLAGVAGWLVLRLAPLKPQARPGVGIEQ